MGEVELHNKDQEGGTGASRRAREYITREHIDTKPQTVLLVQRSEIKPLGSNNTSNKMTTQQGELLIRQKNAQTQRPEWARAYVVLAVDERQLFCFTDEKFDAPRCVLQLRGATVGRVDGARDGTHRFSVVTDAPPPRSFLPAAAAAALAAGAATASLALAGAALLALAAALLAAVAPRVQRAGGAKVLLAATSRRRAETWRQHVASCVEINQCVGCTRQFFT